MSLFSPDLGQGGPEGLGERKGRPLGGGWEPGTRGSFGLRCPHQFGGSAVSELPGRVVVEVRREWGALPWALSSEPEPEPGSLLGELSLGLLTEDLDSHLGLGASALRLASRTAP